jgi:hypothetical protein
LANPVRFLPDGRLVASVETIARLKALCAEDAEMLRAAEAPPPQPGDDVEHRLLGLIHEVSVEANRSLRLAREAVYPGGEVEARTIAVGDSYRLCKALAMLTEELARHRGNVAEQRIVVQHVTGGQAVGMVVR